VENAAGPATSASSSVSAVLHQPGVVNPSHDPRRRQMGTGVGSPVAGPFVLLTKKPTGTKAVQALRETLVQDCPTMGGAGLEPAATCV
jgi:hypothetical protein